MWSFFGNNLGNMTFPSLLKNVVISVQKNMARRMRISDIYRIFLKFRNDNVYQDYASFRPIEKVESIYGSYLGTYISLTESFYLL